ncbi:transmembrane protein 209 [Euwallacea similis]|uniref:transmembrane protein 209 n=1 Tax=Euwallacea similis TaxID=1736056 RepID=UPI003450219B
MTSFSPNRVLNSELQESFHGSAVLERSLLLNKRRYKLKGAIFWFGINVLLLSIIIYDLSQTCRIYMNYYQYIEYSFVVILTLNVVYYFGKIIKLYFAAKEQIPVTLEQRKLLGVKDSDPNYTLISPIQSPQKSSDCTPLLSNTPLNMTTLSWRSNASSGPQTTPLNMTALSWRSNLSVNDSVRVGYSPQSTGWTFKESKLLGEEEEDEYEEGVLENINNLATTHSSNNLLSSFWSHPVTKSVKDMSSFLKKSQYQLSTLSPTKNLSPLKTDDKSSGSVPALEVWTRVNVNTDTLTQWNENLRMWLSHTILERLIHEFDLINDSLEKHGMSDIKIGAVGLDRLRKTALMTQITHFIPSLPPMIPFLEVHANQEYLVKRIRDLAKGGCMSEFKWNGGCAFNGKDWDESLPTDCAIVMHLLASYLDTQLMPSPNLPDAKTFTGHYYIKSTDKMPTLTANSLFIQEICERPPHYQVVVGEKIYEMVKGYNNLFHSCLFFIYLVDKMEQGMLGRVNLGRAGLNMLWVIGLSE